MPVPAPGPIRSVTGAESRRDRRPAVGVEAEQLDGGRAVAQAREQSRLLLRPGPSRGEHLVDRARLDDHDPVGIAHHPVAGAHRDVADAHGPADRAPGLLDRAAQRDAAGEHREAVVAQRVDVAHAGVDHEAGEAARLGRGRQHLAPVAPFREAVDLDDERAPGGRGHDSDVDGEVVGRGALHGERRRREPRAGPGGAHACAMGSAPDSPRVAAPRLERSSRASPARRRWSIATLMAPVSP